MQVRRNERTIRKAFEGFMNNERQFMISGMKGLLDAAVIFALRIHQEKYLHNHLETGDSYGWALGYRGQCIAIKVNTWDDLPTTDAQITSDLMDIVCRFSSNKDNYVGVVMAGMEPVEYYNVNMELEVLGDTINFVEGDFERYFQKI